MKLAFTLAYKNLMGAGLRTWLNAIVLAFTFILIIVFNGIMDGWNEQAKRDGVAWEYGYGQLLHKDYDPYDPFTLLDGHGVMEESQKENLTPILIRQATIYPDGRMLPISLKGIDPDQNILNLPTASLKESENGIHAIIGKRMAKSAGLEVGSQVLLRWRDQYGVYDAANITITEIFDCNVASVDVGQVWIANKSLYQMTGLQNHATLYIANNLFEPKNIEGWKFQSQEDMLQQITEIIEMKKSSSSIMYLLLLAIALLAIFDTQVMSIFRRQKEIGSYIAMGMTKKQVMVLFTVEGAMYSVLGTVLGAIVGAPFFYYLYQTGFGIPAASQDMGITIAERIYPVFSLFLVVNTILLLIVSATVVSFLPARKISKMNPVDALKGKVI